MRSTGQDCLLVAVDAAIQAGRRRAVGRRQVNPAIAAAVLQNQELALRQVLDGRSIVERAEVEAKLRQQSLADIQEEQARMGK